MTDNNTTNGRLIAIGDIHAQYDSLVALLDKINPTQEDIIIFIGDYIDRGFRNLDVVKYLHAKKREFPNWYFLMGNHDDWAVSYSYVEILKEAPYSREHREKKEMWKYNGGEVTIQEFESASEEDRAIIAEFFLDLKIFIQVDYTPDSSYVFVHGGVPVYSSLKDFNEILKKAGYQKLIWERDHLTESDKFLKSVYGNHKVVCGHTVHREPMNRRNVLCIDTGSFLVAGNGFKDTWGRITAVVLPENPMDPPLEFIRSD